MKKDNMELDTSRLCSGMVVKNYKEMCKLLNVEEMKNGGNSKKSQIEQWRRFFDWEADGQRFIILSVYEEPIPGMLPDSAVYAKFMQLVLMEIMNDIEGGIYHFFPTWLMEKMGMVNRDYKQLVSGDEGREKMFGPDGSEDNTISILGANKITSIIHNRLIRILDDALKSMDRNGIIHYNKEYCVKETPWEIRGGFRSATKQEEKLIIEMEQKVLNEFGITDKWYAYSVLKEPFSKKINKYIHESKSDLYGATRWIEIVYSKPPVEYYNKVVDKIIRDINKKGYNVNENDFYKQDVIDAGRKVLNDLVCKSLDKQAQKEIRNAMNNVGKGYVNNDLIFYVLGETFLMDFMKLIDRYVRLKEE